LALGFQQLDERFVRLFMGHDGSLLEHSTRSYQVHWYNIWNRRILTARCNAVVSLCLIVK